ncbi:unnamed protein product, partial [Musa acuminata var. zebrina]
MLRYPNLPGKVILIHVKTPDQIRRFPNSPRRCVGSYIFPTCMLRRTTRTKTL